MKPFALLILLPVLLLAGGLGLTAATGQYRVAMESALCQTNLRAIGLAMRQYAADHNGRFPDACDQSVRPWRWWDEDLHQYVQDLRIFYCPTKTPQYFPLLPAEDSALAPTTIRTTGGEEIVGIPLDVRAGSLFMGSLPPAQPKDQSQGQKASAAYTVQAIPLTALSPEESRHWTMKARGDRSPLLPVRWQRNDIGYGMNYRFSSVYAEIKTFDLQRLRTPEKIVVVGDSHSFLLRPTETMWRQDSAPRHGGQANFLFADGHVESLDPQSDSYSRAGAPGILDLSHWNPQFTSSKP